MTVEVVKLRSDYVLSLIRTVIHWNFSDSLNYSEMPVADYHVKVNAAQNAINEQGIGAIIAWNVREDIARYCNSKHVMLQSLIYLRAARPGLADDVVGWHRESMYGASVDSVNLWMPVLNVTPENSLRYMPNTENAQIDIEQDVSQVERGSAGHKIGLLPEPKRIVKINGLALEFCNSEPIIVPDGSVALFPGSLIHGAAVNHSNKIRFSVDVRLLAR
jgi:hypothetical protein